MPCDLHPAPLPEMDAASLHAALGAIRAWWLAPPRDAEIAAVSASTGWPVPHAREAVRRAFAPFTPAALARLVRIGAARPVPVPLTKDQGPTTHDPSCPWLLAILAGRVPALAANVVFWSLAARRPVVLKAPSGTPAFAHRLAASVGAVAPALAGCVRAVDLAPGDPRLEALVRDAPACLVYGGDRTIEAVAAARAGRPTLAGGHRESLVVAFREALTATGAARLARAIAVDASIYDQSGCLSPHLVLAEPGGEVPPVAFAGLLLEALARAGTRLPPAPPALPEAAALRLFLEESRLLARAAGGAVLVGPRAVAPAVIVAPAGYRPGPGHRVVQVVPFEGLPDLARLAPSLSGRVQGLAVAGDRRRLAALLDANPAFRPCRTCAPGRLQRPPAIWAENGGVVTGWLVGGP